MTWRWPSWTGPSRITSSDDQGGQATLGGRMARRSRQQETKKGGGNIGERTARTHLELSLPTPLAHVLLQQDVGEF